MKTPENEVHILVETACPGVPIPPGEHLRIYSKRRNGRIYVARSRARSGPWKEMGTLDVRLLHSIVYGLGFTLDELGAQLDPTVPIDLMSYRRQKETRAHG